MTLNSLEVTKCCKKLFYFIFECLHKFLFFTFSILIIIFGQTCYGTTVPYNNIEHTHTKILLSTLQQQSSWGDTNGEVFDH